MTKAFDYVAGRAPAFQEILELDQDGNVISTNVTPGDNIFSPALVVEEPVAADPVEEVIDTTDHNTSILGDEPVT